MENIRTPGDRNRSGMSELERAAWPEMPGDLIERLREDGEVHKLKAGEALFETGQSGYDFAYLLKGELNIVDPTTKDVVVRIDEGNFAGELGMLMCQSAFMDGIMETDGKALVVPQARFKELLQTDSELSALVIDAFTARRKLLVEWGEGGLVIIGEEDSPCCVRALSYLSRNQIPHRHLKPSEDADAIAELAKACPLPDDADCIAIVGNQCVLANPEPRCIADAVGLDIKADSDRLFDVAIIGAGPGGLSAAVYAASEGLATLIIEDTAIGGQAGTSSRIENYMGFPAGISGSDLAYRGEVQAVKFGAYLTAPRRVTELEKDADGTFRLTLNTGDVFRTRAVILANGVQYRRLPLDGIEDYEGAGIYYAATSLEARFCKDTTAVVIGGGNSAGQAAMFLSDHADCTKMVVRGEGLTETMSSYLSERIHSSKKIDLLTESEVVALHGEDRLEAVTLRHNPDGDETRIDTNALFIMIGAVPNTDWLPDAVALDEKGFIKTGDAIDTACGPYATSVPGLYAVGDVRSGSVKRVASATGEGAVVVSFIHRYLSDLDVAKREGGASEESAERETETA